MVARQLFATCLSAGLALACSSDLPDAVKNREPVLNLVLTTDSLEQPVTDLRALLATVTSGYGVVYRSADRFVMRRL
jgi:hypothetical protein